MPTSGWDYLSRNLHRSADALEESADRIDNCLRWLSDEFVRADGTDEIEVGDWVRVIVNGSINKNKICLVSAVERDGAIQVLTDGAFPYVWYSKNHLQKL